MVESRVNDINLFCGNGDSRFVAKYCLEVAVSSGFSIITFLLLKMHGGSRCSHHEIHVRDPRSPTTQEKEGFHIFLNKGHSCEKALKKLRVKEEELCKIKKKSDLRKAVQS